MAKSGTIPITKKVSFEKIFESIFRDAKDNTGNVYCWKTLLRFTVKHEAYIGSRAQLEYISKYMVSKLLSHCCSDFEIVSRILMMYHRWIVSRLVTEDDSHPLNLGKIKCVISPLNRKHANLGADISDGEKLLLAIDDGDLVFTKVLVKYGVFCNHKSFYLADVPRGMKTLLNILYYMKLKVFHQEPSNRSCFRESMNVLEKCRNENGKLVTNQRGFHRLFLLLRTLTIVIYQREEHPSTNDYIQCIKLYFTTVADPFVTIDEIKEFLYYLFNKEDNYQQKLEEFIQIYKEIFHPESTFTYSPRSLTHLSRCSARKYLQRNSSSNHIRYSTPLPVLVNKENIPGTIKELLLGASELSL